MSTPAITVITQNLSPILVLYRHWDGYPKGHGKELAEFLTGFTITDGRVDLPGKWANGAGCLAAQLVAHFKKGCGDFYLLPTADPAEYDWAYMVEVPLDYTGPAEGLTITVSGEFTGTLSGFNKYLTEI